MEYALKEEGLNQGVSTGGHDNAPQVFDPLSFHTYLLMFSGGKDATSCLLHLLDIGVPRDRIELWHHCVDGEGENFMDWPVTHSYVKAFGAAFGIPVYFSWAVGGFEREMNRTNSLTAPTRFETPDGLMERGGIRGTPSTRLKFPQLSSSLTTRWCSSRLKIDVCSMAIANQKRFDGKRTLVVTGERAQESTARANYAVEEAHRTACGKRYVHHWRPVHGFSEEQVWNIIERHKVNVHPAYHLGFGRCSCMKCIFGSPDQWATVNELDRQGVIKIIGYERKFGFTIRRDGGIDKAIAKGTPYKMDPRMAGIAMSTTYEEPIFLDNWTLPAGAYGESAGPT